MAVGRGARSLQLELVGEPLRAVPAPARPGGRPRATEPKLTRLALGVYLAHTEPLSLQCRCHAMLAVLPGDAAFSHWTAAALLGLPSRDCAKLHVLLQPRRVLPQRAELVVHGRIVEEGDVSYAAGLPVTTGERTYVDLAEYLRIPELVVLGDAVLRAGFTDPFSLAARVQAASGRRGIKRAREALELLDAGAQSVPESLIRYYLLSSDLPKPTTQLPICNIKGIVVAHADLGYEEWRVLIEYEGRQHSDVEQFGRDIERYSRMAADGWTVLRFSSAHLRKPWLIVERVRASLVARGWRPPGSTQSPK